MLQSLLLQGLGDDGHVLQGLQQLNAGLSTLQQDHTLPVGLLLLHQHLQVEEQEAEEVDRKGRHKRLERLERPLNRFSSSLTQPVPILQALHVSGQ